MDQHGGENNPNSRVRFQEGSECVAGENEEEGEDESEHEFERVSDCEIKKNPH